MGWVGHGGNREDMTMEEKKIKSIKTLIGLNKTPPVTQKSNFKFKY